MRQVGLAKHLAGHDLATPRETTSRLHCSLGWTADNRRCCSTSYGRIRRLANNAGPVISLNPTAQFPWSNWRPVSKIGSPMTHQYDLQLSSSYLLYMAPGRGDGQASNMTAPYRNSSASFKRIRLHRQHPVRHTTLDNLHSVHIVARTQCHQQRQEMLLRGMRAQCVRRPAPVVHQRVDIFFFQMLPHPGRELERVAGVTGICVPDLAQIMREAARAHDQ